MAPLVAILAVAFPVVASAQAPEAFIGYGQRSGSTMALVVVGLVVCSIVLLRVWTNVQREASKSSKKEEYTPSIWTIVSTLCCSGVLFLLSINVVGGIAPFDGPDAPYRAGILFSIAAVIAILAQFKWKKANHYVFAITVGTVVTFILIAVKRMLLESGVDQDPFFMALGLISIIIAWRFLFGPWRPIVKATVLGTFIFWVGLHLLWKETDAQRNAHMLAIVVAIIPAIIWCFLFLKNHTQRISLVLLMFFAGMISTAPILFYDMLVRRGVELQFFLFRVVPENFSRSSSAFVGGNLADLSGIKTTLATTLISFLIVGLIEETSKFWVLKKSGEKFFNSIDDVMQLGIIVAIGFAFAENVLNPTYFISFVREFLLYPESPQWGGFIGNVLGRAILTNMVHILSTGVLAYFYGLLIFASPYLEETKKKWWSHPIARGLHVVLRLPEKSVFRTRVIVEGLIIATVLHGLFNFMVTLPDLLPGNPQTLGELFGAAPNSPLHYVALLVIPSMFYVVGGFWLITTLFYKKECMKERGCLVKVDTFVRPKMVA